MTKEGRLTKRQKEILEYIKSEILKRGFPPIQHKKNIPHQLERYLLILI